MACGGLGEKGKRIQPLLVPLLREKGSAGLWLRELPPHPDPNPDLRSPEERGGWDLDQLMPPTPKIELPTILDLPLDEFYHRNNWLIKS